MDDETKQALADNAVRGALYLDRVEPHWYKKIDVSILNMDSCQLCIAGQVFGSYLSNGLLERDDFRYGFIASETLDVFDPLDPKEHDDRYQVLHQQWIVEINKRFAAERL